MPLHARRQACEVDAYKSPGVQRAALLPHLSTSSGITASWEHILIFALVCALGQTILPLLARLLSNSRRDGPVDHQAVEKVPRQTSPQMRGLAVGWPNDEQRSCTSEHEMQVTMKSECRPRHVQFCVSSLFVNDFLACLTVYSKWPRIVTTHPGPPTSRPHVVQILQSSSKIAPEAC